MSRTAALALNLTATGALRLPEVLTELGLKIGDYLVFDLLPDFSVCLRSDATEQHPDTLTYGVGSGAAYRALESYSSVVESDGNVYPPTEVTSHLNLYPSGDFLVRTLRIGGVLPETLPPEVPQQTRDNRGDPPRQGTAAHARRTGEGLGLTGEALALFVAGGAEARHEDRVRRATDALVTAGAALTGVRLTDSVGAREAGILVGMLDQIGVGGGRGGLRRRGTRRVEALASLGKGRKGADDGPAWTSAIRGGVCHLIEAIGGSVEITVYPCPMDCGDLRVLVVDRSIVRRYDAEEDSGKPASGYHETAIDVLLPPEYRPWLRQLSERALMRLGGAPSQADESIGAARFLFRPEDAQAWAYLLNATAEQEEQEKPVMNGSTAGDRW